MERSPSVALQLFAPLDGNVHVVQASNALQTQRLSSTLLSKTWASCVISRPSTSLTDSGVPQGAMPWSHSLSEPLSSTMLLRVSR